MKAGPEFGLPASGISPLGPYPRTLAIRILAAIGDGRRYSNHWEEGDLVFQGEDNGTGDQDANTGHNRALTNATKAGATIYGFCREDSEPIGWVYLGRLSLRSSASLPSGGRLVVSYRLRPLDNLQSGQEKTSPESPPIEDPLLHEPDDRQQSSVERALRSATFARDVKNAYGNACAVCGSMRTNANDEPEVEAAHIYPVSLRGANVVQNGLALCRFHHWAFDGALIGLDVDGIVRVTSAGNRISELQRLDSQPLAVVPNELKKRPHRTFLEARWILTNSGWIRPSSDDEIS